MHFKLSKKILTMIKNGLISFIFIIIIQVFLAMLVGYDNLSRLILPLMLMVSLLYTIFEQRLINLEKGQELLEKGNYDLAIYYYSKAIKIYPIDGATYCNRGVCYARQHEYDKAIADFSRAIKFKAKLDVVYLDRGICYSYKHEYELALADFDTAINLNPKDIDAYLNKGNVYKLQNRNQDAIDTHRMIIKNFSDDKENVEKAKERIRILGGDI